MPIVLRLAVATLAVLALIGCGVRGDPEPPPGAEPIAAPAGQAEPVGVATPVATGRTADIFNDDAFNDDEDDTERVIRSHRRSRHPPMSDSFVLDPLL